MELQEVHTGHGQLAGSARSRDTRHGALKTEDIIGGRAANRTRNQEEERWSWSWTKWKQSTAGGKSIFSGIGYGAGHLPGATALDPPQSTPHPFSMTSACAKEASRTGYFSDILQASMAQPMAGLSPNLNNTHSFLARLLFTTSCHTLNPTAASASLLSLPTGCNDRPELVVVTLLGSYRSQEEESTITGHPLWLDTE